MNKFFKGTKDYLMNINSSSYTQMSNYIILIVLATFIKIFLITMTHGEIFVTGFEICVWGFMMIWLILRLLHSFNMLQGYYSLAGVPVMLFIIVGTSNTYLVYVSIAIVVIGRCFEIKKLFAKEVY